MKFSIFVVLLSLAFLSANYEFTLLNQLIAEKPMENVIISPLSLFQAVSLASNGANGRTQAELLSLIEQRDIFASNEKNLQIEQSVSQTKGLVIANAVMSSFSPSLEFVARCKKFKATVDQLVSAKQVNDWCSAKTNGKITHLLDNISGIEMIILNAVYFKGIWKNKFEGSNTKPGVFHSPKGDQDVKMMFSKMKALYYENDKTQLIELPYTEENVSSFIALPKGNIDEFLADFNMDEYSSYFNSRISKARKQTVELTLPKFELSFQTSFVRPMVKMGVQAAFDSSKADFSNITQQMKLFISDVLQKTYIKFDEEGTEAAAVTGIIMTRSMPLPEKRIIMKVDKPFLLIINHKQIPQANLFIAKIANIN